MLAGHLMSIIGKMECHVALIKASAFADQFTLANHALGQEYYDEQTAHRF